MKKFVRVLLVSMLALALVACGSGDKGQVEGEGKTFEIGVAIYNFDDFMTLYQEEIKKAFAEAGEKDGNTYNVEVLNAEEDPTAQTEQIKNFITKGKDLIIANLVEPESASTVINDAKAADIPVIMINREPSIESMEIWPNKTTYVGVDATQSGRFQGDIINNLDDKGDINGDGVVSYITLMGGLQNVDAIQRTTYSILQLNDLGIESKDVNGEVYPAEWDTDKAVVATESALAKYGKDIEVIFANNDGMAIGAVRALENTGRVVGEDVYVVGVDAIDDAMELLKNGKLTGTVLNDHYNQAHTVVEVGIKAMNGEGLSPYYWHDYVLVAEEKDAELKRSDYRTETIEDIKVRYEERKEIEKGK